VPGSQGALRRPRRVALPPVPRPKRERLRQDVPRAPRASGHRMGLGCSAESRSDPGGSSKDRFRPHLGSVTGTLAARSKLGETSRMKPLTTALTSASGSVVEVGRGGAGAMWGPSCPRIVESQIASTAGDAGPAGCSTRWSWEIWWRATAAAFSRTPSGDQTRPSSIRSQARRTGAHHVVERTQQIGQPRRA
jgi:hypothetical protein